MNLKEQSKAIATLSQNIGPGSTLPVYYEEGQYNTSGGILITELLRPCDEEEVYRLLIKMNSL